MSAPNKVKTGADAYTGPEKLASAFDRPLALSSRAIHADDYINNHQAVAPPLHVSTTYRYSDDPEQLENLLNVSSTAPYDSHIYSRESHPNGTRLEALLSSVIGAPSLTYGSGLAAFHALLVFLNPKRIAIGGGYHGCHGVIHIMTKLTGLEKLDLESDADLARLQPGDIVHVETPLNPTGEARDLEKYRKIADERGAYLTVDATFAPPPLLDPFLWGADAVMHSGTKYFGGHSDMLCGVLSVGPKYTTGDQDWIRELAKERVYLGGVMGSLEGWLGVRSLRTLELRVRQQSTNAQKLIDWLAAESRRPDSAVAGKIAGLLHASQQPEAQDAGSWLRRQMPVGYGPVFALLLHSEEAARRLPSKLHLFHHATSLGGVESLIEWRAMSDATVDRRLLRVSVGLEGWEDLRDDLLQGLRAL